MCKVKASMKWKQKRYFYTPQIIKRLFPDIMTSENFKLFMDDVDI